MSYIIEYYYHLLLLTYYHTYYNIYKQNLKIRFQTCNMYIWGPSPTRNLPRNLCHFKCL